MNKIIIADLNEEVKNVQKKISAIEKNRDLELGEIRKEIEGRQIKKILDSMK